MKILIFLIGFVCLANLVFAQTNTNTHYQKGYVKRSTGTYVAPHNKTTTNSTNIDNFSTKDNTNTYTGKRGSKAKDYSPEAKNYGSGMPIKRGPKGGQYYNSNKGKKTYVPKR